MTIQDHITPGDETNTDITLTEAFWRETYPDADDAEIAQRLTQRRGQVADHVALCDTEAAQDRANMAARAHQPDDGSDDDYEDDQPDAEYIEWDQQGNIAARGWNGTPDRCEHCGAVGQDDHMASCPDHQLSIKDIALVWRKCNEEAQQSIMVLMGLTHAQYGLSREMTRRVVTGGYDADGEFFMAQLSSVSIQTFEKELKLLKKKGYVAYEAVPWDGYRCPACGSTHGTATTYYVQASDGTYDRKSYRGFDICISCLRVSEYMPIDYPAKKPSQTTKEAVMAHKEEQHTIERIQAVQRDTSRVGQTAPMPSSSTPSAGALYATGGK